MFFHQKRRDGGEDEAHGGSVGSVRPLEPEALEIEKGSLTEDVTQNQSSSENPLDDVKVNESDKQQKNLEGSSDNNSTRHSKIGKIISLLFFQMCLLKPHV